MQRYDTYKDSGVKWLGEIPSHWDAVRVKHLFIVSRGRVIAADQMNDEGEYPVYSSQTENNGCMGYISTYDYEGDVLTWTTDGAKAGTVFRRRGKFNCTNVCGVLTPITNNHLGYLYYAIYLAAYYNKRVDILGYKIMSNEMAELKFPLPPFKEQTIIANYLDTATAKIDAAIAQQQKMIDLLNERKQIIINRAVTKGLNPNAKMKDSFVEWIGEVPEEWEMKPIKHFKSTEKNAFVDGPFGSNLKSEHYIENGDVYVIESGMITTGKFINKGFKTISLSHFKTIERSECKSGDVIIAKIGAKFGMAAELPEVSKKCVVSGNSLKITLNQNIMLNTMFVYYMGLAKTRNGFIGLYQETAQPALSLGGLNNMYFPVPPIEEQKDIVDYLNFKLDIIDRAISNYNHQISLLQERKQIIINEVVTGKVKII